jgi:hypothetical protein
MDLTSRQRLLAFAVTVLALAGLGAFLFVTGTGKHHAASPPPRPATSTRPSTVPPPVTTQPAGSTAASSQVNIYRWLPFTEPQLAQAAAVVTKFCDDYGTYSYRESTAGYTSRMQGLATGSLIQVIARGYSAPGVASLRSQQKQVSTASAAINSLRAFGTSSLTFVVTIDQKITADHGTSQQSTPYAVTAASTAGGWQVNDIELASSGDQ